MRIALYGDAGFYSVRRPGRAAAATSSPHPRSARCSAPCWPVGSTRSSVASVSPTTFRRRVRRGPGHTGAQHPARRTAMARAVHRRRVVRGVNVMSIPMASCPSRCCRMVRCRGVVIANELLDNLPFRLAVFDGGWREVAVSARSRRRTSKRSPSPPTPHGRGCRLLRRTARACRCRNTPRRGWRSSTVDARVGSRPCLRLLHGDNGGARRTPWREWLRTYRGHDRGGHYLDSSRYARHHRSGVRRPVACADATSNRRPSSCADLVIDELVDEGRRDWARRPPRPDVKALSMRSRNPRSEALLDVHGLGAFDALSWLVTRRTAD